jgi:hypothetical protein
MAIEPASLEEIMLFYVNRQSAAFSLNTEGSGV